MLQLDTHFNNLIRTFDFNLNISKFLHTHSIHFLSIAHKVSTWKGNNTKLKYILVLNPQESIVMTDRASGSRLVRAVVAGGSEQSLVS